MWTTDFFFRFRSWLKLEGPPEVVLSGYDIRRFLSPSSLSLKLADAFVRLLRSLENETMAKRTKSPGRHYVSPQWGVSSFFVPLPCRFYLMPFFSQCHHEMSMIHMTNCGPNSTDQRRQWKLMHAKLLRDVYDTPPPHTTCNVVQL